MWDPPPPPHPSGAKLLEGALPPPSPHQEGFCHSQQWPVHGPAKGAVEGLRGWTIDFSGLRVAGTRGVRPMALDMSVAA